MGKGDVCPSDTSTQALVAVDQKSVGDKYYRRNLLYVWASLPENF
ncbi:MAG: hypothetical protein WDM78_14470 [Puia sp.]